jgi:hypothetical protein
MDPVPDPLLLRNSGSIGNPTRDLWCSQELWPPDHRADHPRHERSRMLFGCLSLTPARWVHCVTNWTCWKPHPFSHVDFHTLKVFNKCGRYFLGSIRITCGAVVMVRDKYVMGWKKYQHLYWSLQKSLVKKKRRLLNTFFISVEEVSVRCLSSNRIQCGRILCESEVEREFSWLHFGDTWLYALIGFHRNDTEFILIFMKRSSVRSVQEEWCLLGCYAVWLL